MSFTLPFLKKSDFKKIFDTEKIIYYLPGVPFNNKKKIII